MAYKEIQKILPYDIEHLIYTFIWEDKNKINNKYQGSLFCIDYYGIQKDLGNNIFNKNKIIPIINYGKGIYEYSKEELTEKNRKDTINLIKQFKNLQN